MSEVFDDIIDRETDVARIAAVVASDFRFAYFGTGAFAVRLLRLDQKLADGSDEPAPHGEPAQGDARAFAAALRRGIEAVMMETPLTIEQAQAVKVFEKTETDLVSPQCIGPADRRRR
jgi:hypothetical protein